ncbi:MAG: hypothetical protein ABI867_10680 [Kofleriaceae bacterium]
MIVRSDVPTGVQAAMIVHAAGHAAQLPGARSAAPPTVAVALSATLDELCALVRVLVAEDLPHVLVREPDEPYRNAPMAIGMVPMPRERVRRLFAHLPLVRGKALP